MSSLFGQHCKLIFPVVHIQTHVASFIWPPPDCEAIRISSVALDQDSCNFKALCLKIHGNVSAVGSRRLKCPVLYFYGILLPQTPAHHLSVIEWSLTLICQNGKTLRQVTRHHPSTVSRQSHKNKPSVYSETSIIL